MKHFTPSLVTSDGFIKITHVLCLNVKLPEEV